MFQPVVLVQVTRRDSPLIVIVVTSSGAAPVMARKSFDVVKLEADTARAFVSEAATVAAIPVRAWEM